MAISQVFILSLNCDLIASKSYRPDVAIDSVAEFRRQLSKTGGNSLEPAFMVNGVHFYHIKRHKLCFLATTCHDLCPVAAVEILSRIYQICKDCCGTVNEQTLKMNYILIQEILDEIMDYGYVQSLSTEKVKPFLFSEPAVMKSPETRVSGLVKQICSLDRCSPVNHRLKRVLKFGVEHKQTSVSTKPVIRSKTDTEDRKNEVYVDVVERISSVFDKNGVITRCIVNGQVCMKTFLVSGSQIMMSLNESLILKKDKDVKGYGSNVYLENSKFHPNVNHESLETKKILTVSPPSGEFCVMSYTVSGELANGLPFKLKSYCKVNPNNKDLNFGMRLSCDIVSSCTAVNVAMRVPLPKSTISISQQLSGEGQSAQYLPEENLLVWKIKKMAGKSETTGHFQLIEANLSEASQQQIGPASLDFEISGYLSSNLQIRQLKVVDSDKTCPIARWVRYITTPESYLFQLY